MAIKIGGTTIVTDGRGVTNITSGVIVGVKSDGTYLGAGATTLNFVGSAVSIRAVDADRVDVIVSGGGGGGGAIGISSNVLNVDPAKNTLVGSGVTHINFVGAAATMVGLTTAVVTVNKSLTIGRRVTAVTIELTNSAAIIGLRDGSTASIPV